MQTHGELWVFSGNYAGRGTELMGGAYMNGDYGVTVDGTGDYVAITSDDNDYISSRRGFGVSFWFTKSVCNVPGRYEILYEHVRDIDGWPLSGCRHSRPTPENCDANRGDRGNATIVAMCRAMPQDDQTGCEAAGCDYDAAQDGTCRDDRCNPGVQVPCNCLAAAVYCSHIVTHIVPDTYPPTAQSTLVCCETSGR